MAKPIKPTPTCPEEEAYLAYIDEHRKNVYTAFMRFGSTLCLALSLVHGEYDVLRRFVSSHDNSKYSEEEFEGYRQWFYPKEGEEKDKDTFNKAWKHHYEHNPHHWEHHLANGKPKPMSKLNIAEMILDWIAMSIKFKNSPLEWYKKNKDRINLEKRTRDQVESILVTLAATKLYPFYVKKRTNKNGRRPVHKK